MHMCDSCMHSCFHAGVDASGMCVRARVHWCPCVCVPVCWGVSGCGENRATRPQTLTPGAAPLEEEPIVTPDGGAEGAHREGSAPTCSEGRFEIRAVSCTGRKREARLTVIEEVDFGPNQRVPGSRLQTRGGSSAESLGSELKMFSKEPFFPAISKARGPGRRRCGRRTEQGRACDPEVRKSLDRPVGTGQRNPKTAQFP